MYLFGQVVEEHKLHNNFKYVFAQFRSAERELFLKWVEGFEGGDGQVIKEFQVTFNSTFWKMYLHACFREYGFERDWFTNS